MLEKLVFKIGDKEVSLTWQEAGELHKELDMIFAKNVFRPPNSPSDSPWWCGDSSPVSITSKR